MQVVASVVDIQLISISVDRQAALVDTVSETADERAQISAVFEVFRHGVVAEQYIDGVPVFVGHDQTMDNAPQRKHLHLSLSVLERKDIYFPAVGHISEYGLCNFRHKLLLI